MPGGGSTPSLVRRLPEGGAVRLAQWQYVWRGGKRYGLNPYGILRGRPDRPPPAGSVRSATPSASLASCGGLHECGTNSSGRRIARLLQCSCGASLRKPLVRRPKRRLPTQRPVRLWRVAYFGQWDRNNFARPELSRMPQRRPISTGPMSVQPAEHQSIAPTQSQPMLPTTDKVPQPVRNKTSTRAEAIRVAKARIVRRNSLRKQRQLQKD